MLDAAPVTLIGSSFGGLAAAWLGERHQTVERLVLLAPAFNFWAHWLPRLGETLVQGWQTDGVLPIYHYAEAKMLPLGYQFVEDAANYSEDNLQRAVPTLILHGKDDEVIPVQASIDFARKRPWVELVELDSDHALTNVGSDIWQAIQQFCQLQ